MFSTRQVLFLSSLACVFLVVGCSSSPSSRAGKFYDHDGPPDASHGIETEDLSELKIEKPSRAASRPYTVMGKRYYPMSGDEEFTQVGIASWYGKQFHGKKTAIGERYNMFAMTAAHPTMELPSYARVTNLKNGLSVIVRVNDRGPFLGGRAIDMSYAAAVKLGYHKAGTTRVKIERISRRSIASGKVFATNTSPAKKPVEAPSTPKEDAEVIEQGVALVESAETTTETTAPDSTPATDAIATIVAKDSSSQTEPSIDEGAVSIEEPQEGVATEVATDSQAPDAIDALLGEEKASTTTPLWRVQVGAFSSEVNAREVAAHTEMMLSENQLSTSVQVFPDGNLYRVLVGGEKEHSAASAFSKKINTLLGVSSFVIQR